MPTDVEQRVDNLESVLQRFIVSTEKSIVTLAEDRQKDRTYFNALFERHIEQNRLALEKYKEENKADFEKYKEENKADFEKYKEENKADFEKYKEENKADFEKYREENKADFEKYKDENKADFEKYREENKAEFKNFTQRMNKDWGDLANKMGTLIEDLFMPGVGPSVKRYFNSDIEFIGTHMKKHIKKLDLKGEFDVVATDEERVFVVDVKSSIDKEKIDEFKKQVLPRFQKLFPEYDSKTLIPIMGSLRFNNDTIKYASKEGIYVLGYREWEYLDILNFDEVKSKE